MLALEVPPLLRVKVIIGSRFIEILAEVIIQSIIRGRCHAGLGDRLPAGGGDDRAGHHINASISCGIGICVRGGVLTFDGFGKDGDDVAIAQCFATARVHVPVDLDISCGDELLGHPAGFHQVREFDELPEADFLITDRYDRKL